MLIIISKQTIINLILVVGGPDLLLDIGLALPVCKKLMSDRDEPPIILVAVHRAVNLWHPCLGVNAKTPCHSVLLLSQAL